MKKIIAVLVLPVVVALLLWAAAGAQAADGWYLMMPPPAFEDVVFPDGVTRQAPGINRDAPLSEWKQLGAYDSAAACQSHKSRIRGGWEQAAREARNQESAFLAKLEAKKVLVAYQCVSAADPRLVAVPTPQAPTVKPPEAEPTKPATGGLSGPCDEGIRAGESPVEAGIRLSLCKDREPGTGIVRYTPGRPIIATVKLNGRITARLILDTGADGSMVKPDLLAAAGVDLSRPAARGTGTSVTGKVQVSYFAVDFEVAGHRARVPRVAAFNTYEDGFADGLLGRDFLDRFKVVMDPAAGTVTVVPR